MSKRPVKRLFLLRPWFIGLVCTVVAGTWFVFGKSGVWASHELRQQKIAQMKEIYRLEEQKRVLQQYLNSLKAGDELALERAARDRGFVAPGETLYDIRIEPDTTK